MMMPRCGVPDITNGTTSMRSGKKKHHHGPNSLHTVSHYSFFPGHPRWPASKTHLTYRFHSSVQITSIDTLRSVCSQAFARWAQVTLFSFQEVQGGNAADIEIGFHRGDHGDNAPFDGPRGTLAHAYSPTIGKFHYDADESWGTNPSPGVTDLESVAVHEIGHLLGLMHSSVPGAIMYPTIPSGVTKRQLHGDDIQGIRTLYAFATWLSVTHFTFEETQDYTNADITIGVHSSDHGDGHPFDGPGGTLAHAYAPTDGRFHYDADETWAIGSVPSAFDLETVALHEIGHLLGLEHSSIEDVIMFPTIPIGVRKGLHGDDVQGILALYSI
ncbi:hypothetical protein HHK36_024866 [Tetracentron sinense]|uniref:Peptidase metallopeptidase domain-containing protein n=1 Tax=Tetracentron sinense TaxID=13715 RepID=A0A834YNW2_TETSI|nr:hypothetical protein HHK36_024866 [Tetracentron sinense]